MLRSIEVGQLERFFQAPHPDQPAPLEGLAGDLGSGEGGELAVEFGFDPGQ